MVTAAAAREKIPGRRYVIVLTVFFVRRKLRIDHYGGSGQMRIASLLLMLVMVPTSGGRIHQEGTHVSLYLFFSSVTHTTLTIVRINQRSRTSGFFGLFLSRLLHQFLDVKHHFSVNIHSHELTLHDTALWSIVHTSPASL